MKRKQQAKTQRVYTYLEFLTLYPCCSASHKRELEDIARHALRTDFVGSAEVPKNFNAITYGDLDDLRSATASEDPIAESIKIILKLDMRSIYEANCMEVFGFSNFCREELSRINNLFATIKVNYSLEEVSAGVHDLDFGSFGVLDWYARRMGMTNQNDVRDVAWIRIYNCMKNDCAQNNFERRLQKQYMQR